MFKFTSTLAVTALSVNAWEPWENPKGTNKKVQDYFGAANDFGGSSDDDWMTQDPWQDDWKNFEFDNDAMKSSLGKGGSNVFSEALMGMDDMFSGRENYFNTINKYASNDYAVNTYGKDVREEVHATTLGKGIDAIGYGGAGTIKKADDKNEISQIDDLADLGIGMGGDHMNGGGYGLGAHAGYGGSGYMNAGNGSYGSADHDTAGLGAYGYGGYGSDYGYGGYGDDYGYGGDSYGGYGGYGGYGDDYGYSGDSYGYGGYGNDGYGYGGYGDGGYASAGNGSYGSADHDTAEFGDYGYGGYGDGYGYGGHSW